MAFWVLHGSLPFEVNADYIATLLGPLISVQ